MKKNYTMKVRVPKRLLALHTWAFLLLCAILGNGLTAQVSTYTFSQTTSTYTEITGGTVLATATGNTAATSLDTGVFAVVPSFTFMYNGSPVTNINMSANGFITFGATPPDASTATPVSGTIAYDGAASPFSRNISSVFDIAGQTGEMRWQTVGTAPNREMVFQWKNFRPTQSTSTTSVYTLSFQVRLKESSNEISFVYSNGGYIVGGTSSISGTLQIGLRGASNADYINRTNSTSIKFVNSTDGTANSSTQAFNTLNDPPGMPSDGLTYNWLPPTCFLPLAPFTYNATTVNSTGLSWTAPGVAPAAGYEVYYSTTNTAPTSSTVLDASNSVIVPAGAPSAAITGLATATQYFVWIRSRCSSSDTTAWVSAGSFSTLCNSFTVPYSENFDSTPVGTTTNNNAPNCWKYLEPAGWPGYGYVYSTANFSAPNSYYIYSTNTTGGGMLVSPPTSNLMNGLNRVRFMASAGGANYFMEVGTLSDPNDPSTFTAIGSPINLGPTSSAWDEYAVYIPAGTNQYLAFRHPGQTGSGTSIRIDDIFVEVTPACDRPDNLAVTGFTANSVSLAWVAPVVTSPQNYTVYYSTSNVAPTASTVLDVNNSLTVSGLSATVPALNANTTYYFWVRSNCAGSDVSTWTNTVVSGYTGYCIPATGTTTTRYVETITTTGGMTNLNYSASSYTPYVDQSANTFSTYPSGTINYSIDASTTSSTYYYIWVDWNNDLDFEDAGEKVLGTGSVATAVGALTIPSTTPLGTYRVRVAAATASTIGACGTPANGSYVDFTLVVVAPTGCIAPSNFTVSNETSNTAQVSWTASVTPPANGYEVYYSTVNTAPTAATILDASNSVASTTTSATVSGLAPSTVYYIWIRSKCSGSDFSVWSGGISFTTLCAPFTAPFTESFSSSAVPNCWSNVNPTTTSTSTSAFWKFSGAPEYGASIVNSVKPAGTFAWVDASTPYTGEHTVQLITPQINLAGLTAPYLQFEWYKNHLTSATGTTVPAYDNNKLLVHISSDGTTWTEVFADDTNSSVWRTVGIAIPSSFVGSTIQVRFTVDKDVAGNGYFYDDLLLDEVAVIQNPNLATTEVISQADDIKVYPNPFTDLVNISDVKDLKSVSVIDMSGRLVKTIANPGRQINLSELKSGLYILKLDYKDGTAKTVKAVKK
ncbi:fibronectin type III domain-containing protein [Kaistella sp. PBT33-4]|uniref:fibronectin type III domain-containing protein n=1 Tax=Kaistella sp. PBT33-4 TaxID=3032000 RepID=UPI0023D7C33D|nr:fibronectin type III domain-containing protein [Kaistella sp. PBT33-4]MDF0718896.1 fibronectin type III domain-containing protein [Kaistella sp. PBT33-4]